jgi:2-iminobutanoate/2-iminopropanoate deaminase
MNGIQRHDHPAGLPLSRAVRAGGFLFLSGQLAVDGQGNILGDDIETQTRVVLEQIAQSLHGLGAGMARVVKSTVWLADMQDFPAFNAEYRRHFPEGFPVRSTVEARLFKGALVEIEVQAWVGTEA